MGRADARRARFDLPAGARRYIARLEEVTGVPARIISTGSDRDDTIIRDDGDRRGVAEAVRPARAPLEGTATDARSRGIALRCRGLVKRYGDVIAVDGLDLEVRAASASACSGRTAPARPRRSRSSKACSRRRRRRRGARPALGPRRSRAARAARHSAPGDAAHRQADGRGDVRLFRSFYPARADRRRDCSRWSSSRRSATLVRQAVGRAEAAAGGRVRAGRRARSAVPRRADHRPRPAVAPAAVGRARAASAKQAAPILLTTHYMDEAEALCDRVAIVDKGKLIALGHAARARSPLGAEHVIEFAWPTGALPLDEAAARAARRHRRARARARPGQLASPSPRGAAGAARRAAASVGAELNLLTTHSATLEDVFVLTGRHRGRHLRDA